MGCLCNFFKTLFGLESKPEKPKGMSEEERARLRQIRIEKYKDSDIVRKIKQNLKKKEKEEEYNWRTYRDERILKDWKS